MGMATYKIWMKPQRDWLRTDAPGASSYRSPWNTKDPMEAKRLARQTEKHHGWDEGACAVKCPCADSAEKVRAAAKKKPKLMVTEISELLEEALAKWREWAEHQPEPEGE